MFGNKWRFQWNSNFNFSGTVILQLWLLSVIPFRHFGISPFRYFAILPFRVLNTPRIGSTDYYGPVKNEWMSQSVSPPPPSRPNPRNKMENKNKDFTHCSRLSNRSLCQRALLGKCDRRGFSLGRKLCHCRSLHICHFLCWFTFIRFVFLSHPWSC